jgi:hypothetical protein
MRLSEIADKGRTRFRNEGRMQLEQAYDDMKKAITELYNRQTVD